MSLYDNEKYGMNKILFKIDKIKKNKLKTHGRDRDKHST